MSAAPGRRLRELDAALVPRLAAGLRRLLDSAGRGSAGARSIGLSAGRPRDPHTRSSGTGPLALLRDVPQLGLLLVAGVLLAGAGIALARNDPGNDTGNDPGSEQSGGRALPLDLGPPVGVEVDEYLAAAGERAVALSQGSPERVLLALVSLSEEVTPAQAAELVAGSRVVVRRAYVRAPVGAGAEVLAVETPGEVAADLTALYAATAARRAVEQRELELLAASITAVDDRAQRARQRYADDARTRGLEAAAYRAGCSCVLALVVEGAARELAGLTALPAVRGLEVARRGAALTALRIEVLPPELTGVRPEPTTAVPDGS